MCRVAGVVVWTLALTTGLSAAAVKLVPSDGAALDQFGFAVSLDSGRLAVGARQQDEAGDDAGAAYLFRQVAGAWEEEQKLTASDAAPGAQFGFALALRRRWLLVGAPFAGDAGASSGSAYVFERTPGDWVETQKLVVSDADQGDELGFQVALDGDWLAVTAWKDDEAGVEAGAVYVFHRDGTSWQEAAKLTASDAAAGDRLGGSVALEGERLAVGAERHGGKGAVYVFRRSGAAWTEEAKLVAPDGAAGDELGHSVNLVGDKVVAGAPFRDAGRGAVYLFQRGAAGWEFRQKLTASDGAAGDQLGRHSPQLNTDVLVAGAANQDQAGSNAGAVYVFRRRGDTWVEAEKLVAPDAFASAQFGWWLDLFAYDLATGAHVDWNDGLLSGAAYVVALPLACGDGLDNDLDGHVDVDDPGCPSAVATPEDPACDDGEDNDGDGAIDLADPQCLSAGPYSEAPRGCGLGVEIAVALGLLSWIMRRRRHAPGVADEDGGREVRGRPAP
jgi:hypothetical protein